MQVIDKNAPLRYLSNREIKRKDKPWITKGIRKSISEKNRLLKTFLKNKSDFYYQRYKFHRDRINHLIPISKKNYYNNFFLENSKNIKKIWHI